MECSLVQVYGTFVCLSLLVAVCQSIKCWQCIADNCDDDPAYNFKATMKACLPGQSCQKVYYEVKSLTEKTSYTSTVRSCSVGRCEPRNDFVNCTADNRENPGCMQRHCCDDTDLCNTASTPSVLHTWKLLSLLLLTGFFIGMCMKGVPNQWCNCS